MKNKMQYVEFAAEADIVRFYHYIYDDATMFLNRKKELFDEYIGLRLVLSMGRKTGRKLKA
jgi:hypothetical protein